MEKIASYSKFVKEVYWPSVSEDKKLEVEKHKA